MNSSGAQLAQAPTPKLPGAVLTEAPSSQIASSSNAAEAPSAAPHRATPRTAEEVSNSSAFAARIIGAGATGTHDSSSIVPMAPQWQAAFDSLIAQQTALAREVAALNSKLDLIAATIANQATASNNTELMTRLLEIVANIASHTASNQQLIGTNKKSNLPSTKPTPVTVIQKKKAVKKKAGISATSTSSHKPRPNDKTISKNALTVNQAARLLKKNSSTVRRWCEFGKLKARKVNGQWRIEKNSLPA